MVIVTELPIVGETIVSLISFESFGFSVTIPLSLCLYIQNVLKKLADTKTSTPMNYAYHKISELTYDVLFA